jgi:hypothetical protein
MPGGGFSAFLSDSDDEERETEAQRKAAAKKKSEQQQKNQKKQKNELQDLALGGGKKSKKNKKKKGKQQNTEAVPAQESFSLSSPRGSTNGGKAEEGKTEVVTKEPLHGTNAWSTGSSSESKHLQPSQPPPQLKAPMQGSTRKEGMTNQELMKENSHLKSLLAEERQQHQLVLRRYQDLQLHCSQLKKSAPSQPAAPSRQPMNPGQHILQLLQGGSTQATNTTVPKLAYSSQRLKSFQEKCTVAPADLLPFYPLQCFGDVAGQQDEPSSTVGMVTNKLVKMRIPMKASREYAQVFVDEGFESEDAIKTLTEEDLEVMAIKKDHIRLILKAIA